MDNFMKFLNSLRDQTEEMGVRRWSICKGKNLAVAHRRVFNADTGEIFLQSAGVDITNGKFLPNEDGEIFRVGDPILDPPAKLEQLAETALHRGEDAQCPQERSEEYRWAAAYGSSAAVQKSAKGALLASEAYHRLGDKKNAEHYRACANR